MVYSDGIKCFIFGGRIRGCYYVIGDFDGGCWVLFCEGWVIGAIFYEVIGLLVVCVMNCGNLKVVVEQFVFRY